MRTPCISGKEEKIMQLAEQWITETYKEEFDRLMQYAIQLKESISHREEPLTSQ